VYFKNQQSCILQSYIKKLTHNLKQPPSSTLRLFLAWAFVGIPALWGVFQTLIKVLALFR
jgi:hypothetical protein